MKDEETITNDNDVYPFGYLNATLSKSITTSKNLLPQSLLITIKLCKTESQNRDVATEPAIAREAAEQEELIEPNPYLLLRESKISRNRDRLAKLGLATSFDTDNTGNDRPRKYPLIRTRVGRMDHAKHEIVDTPSTVVSLTRRRSSRLRIGKNGDCGAGSNLSRDENINKGDVEPIGANVLSTKTKARKRTRGAPTSLSTWEQPPVRQIEPGFTRSTSLDIHTILFGYPLSAQDDNMKRIHHNDHHRGGMVGRRLESTGKAAVVNSSARLSHNLSNGEMLRFNKYSGICEWKNDVIFLWVNIGAPQSDVVNEFLQGGRQVTWFGGSRMHQQTPAIQNLLRVGKMISNQKSTVSNKNGGIILWCRTHDPIKRTFLPYTCLGRVGYRSHDPDVHPIRFVWDLLDYEALLAVSRVKDDKDSDDLGEKNGFQQILFQASK